MRMGMCRLFQTNGDELTAGWCSNDFAECNGFRIRALRVMILFDIIMVCWFSVAITLVALLTYGRIVAAKRLNSASVDISIASRDPLLPVQATHCTAMSMFVPLVFVYIPYFLVNQCSFIGLPSFALISRESHHERCENKENIQSEHAVDGLLSGMGRGIEGRMRRRGVDRRCCDDPKRSILRSPQLR
ncbi:hypothetical protein PRIPAC_82978 [Pristionchus pacificus]|uniref:Uncharacterized protein n=1 Tax=Pristionchus pacificus TaxID=54126 RepID=A0A2A6CJD4_PRIPA|nr:hypothetical protein PRIPAC_82978 [Pristionchus pacificus]|eukprot:PDM78220.1 hypothetical protein PRIPAC_30799 [Pristionchus pacificus]